MNLYLITATSDNEQDAEALKNLVDAFEEAGMKAASSKNTITQRVLVHYVTTIAIMSEEHHWPVIDAAILQYIADHPEAAVDGGGHVENTGSEKAQYGFAKEEKLI